MSNRFLIVDKPTNILSHDLTSRIGRLFGVKAGHAGTLDPNVGGVFVIGLGRYTRLLRFLSGLGKEYVCLAKYPHQVSKKEIQRLTQKIGRNAQVPPKQSAVAKRLRYRMLYDLNILEVFDSRILFKARVESGFYMRVLCSQLGANMEDLRRTSIGPISENKAISVYKVFYNKWNNLPLESYSYSAEEIFSFMPEIKVNKEGARRVSHGAVISNRHIIEKNGEGYVKIMHNDKLLGIGKLIGNVLKYEVILT